jgi:hypothetical protein
MKKLAAMYKASVEEIKEDLEGNTWVSEDALVPEELQPIETAYNELLDAHDDVTNAVEVVTSVSETTELSQEALDSGNAALAVKIANSGISAMCRRIGVESIDLNPSLEEGGGLKRAAMTAWETLVKAFKASVEKFKTFLDHILSYFVTNKTKIADVKADLEKCRNNIITTVDGVTHLRSDHLIDNLIQLVKDISDSADRIKADDEECVFGTHLLKLASDITAEHEVISIEISSHKDVIDRMTVKSVTLVDGTEKPSKVTRALALDILDGISAGQDKVKTLLTDITAAEKKCIAALEKVTTQSGHTERSLTAFRIAIANQKQVTLLVTKVAKLYCGLWNKAVSAIDHSVKSHKDGDHEFR